MAEEKLNSYRDLRVWQLGIELVAEIYTLTRLLPTEEKYGLTSQIRRAAVSVPSNIAEGYGRRARKEYVRHLSIANGSLREVETQLIIAGKIGYLTREQAENAWCMSQNLGKMLAGLIRSLEEPDSRNPTHDSRS